MSMDFKQGNPMPPKEVALSVLSEMTCISAFAASSTIFATIWLRTDSIKLHFMQLLEDHVLLNHRHSVTGRHRAQHNGGTFAGVRIGSRMETLSAPVATRQVRPDVPHTQDAQLGDIDDYIVGAGEDRPTPHIKSPELAQQGECLPATHLEEHFLQVVRAVGTMESLLGTILSWFTICLLAGWVAATYICA